MPLEWLIRQDEAPGNSGAFSHARGDAPLAKLRIWPHRSLPVEGFVWFIAITAAAIALPMLAVLGSPVLWGILPFALSIIIALWAAFRRNYRDGALTEELALWSDRIELVQNDPYRGVRRWNAHPYWVRPVLHPSGGPVEHYLTLKGGGREVQLGAFLSPEERIALYGELTQELARLR